MTANAIFQHFQCNYGHVECVGIYAISELCLAVVTFGEEETAKKASEHKQHTIAGSTVNVWIANELQNQSNLLSLNEDCLLGIFSYFKLDDRIQRRKCVLPLGANDRNGFLIKTSKDKVLALKNKSVERIEFYLRAFGSHVQSISVSAWGLARNWSPHIVLLLS